MTTSPPPPIVVVVVDDDQDTEASTAELLSICGFRTYATTSGSEAVRLAREVAASAIVADLMMPAPDGYTIARQICEDEHRPMLVAVSGCCTESDRAASAAAGFDFHFAKPVDPALIVGCLRRLTELTESVANVSAVA
jgi:CheY-like chemotaxis protein